MNTSIPSEFSNRPVIGRISVIVNRLKPGLTGWDVQEAQRDGHKHIVGCEIDVEENESFILSTVRAGTQLGDRHEVIFTPSGKEEPLKVGMGYVLLISSFPGAEPDDFIVLGFVRADIFMGEFKKFKDLKKNPPQQRPMVKKFVRHEAPVIQQLDHNTVYRLKGRDYVFSGTVQMICDEAMKTFGSEWRNEIKTFQWFKKEGFKYAPTPSKRPELAADNSFAIGYGNQNRLATA